MKRIIASLCAALCLCTLAACGEQEKPSGGETTAGERKIGLGSVCSMTMDGADKNRVKATVAAVIVSKDGKLEECELDELEFTVTLADGKPQTVADLTTKGEKGDAYVPTVSETGGVESTGSWEKQANAFCDFVEGKTQGEISGLAATDGHSKQIDGCVLDITDFIQAVTRAMEMAKLRDIGREDDLSLALIATPDAGTATDKTQYDVEMAAVTLDEQDRITGCMTDTLQAKMTMDQGMFTTVSGTVETKRQMGDGYKMKEASSIKREWYEQADAFDTYARGKTAAELAGIKLSAEGKTDAITGCTIAITGMQRCAAKAAKED